MNAACLYVRCLGWGLATGAVVGGGLGSVIGLLAGSTGSDLYLVGIAALAGLVYGIAVAAVPAVLGGIAVVVVLGWRHPQPASYEAVRRDLTVVFAAVVGLLDLVVLACWVALGGWATLHVVVAVMAVVNAATGLMLKPARTSIARAWAGNSDVAAVARLAPGAWDR